GMDQDFAGASGWLLDPEAAKHRKLLALGLADVERQSPCRQSVDLAARERAKVARPLEHDDLVEQVQSVERAGEAKPGKAQPRLRRQFAGQRAEVEVGIVGRQRANIAAVDQVDVDRGLKKPARWQHLQFEI